MANEADMSSWTDLLHSSTKLLEQAAPSAQFPPLQRNLDQLETLSKKLKAKSLRSEDPSQSIPATRLLAREGINAEQLARDLKFFGLKTTYEDVFPAEAATVEEYLQQVHEMWMISAIQEAQKDNVKGFDDYMLKVLEDDGQKEKRDFLQSLSRISTLPWVNASDSSARASHSGQIIPAASSAQVSAGQSSMEIMPYGSKHLQEKKASVYAEVVKNLNSAREHASPFKSATPFKGAYESLSFPSSGSKSVSMQKTWHLLQLLVARFRSLPSSSEHGPDAAQGQSDARCCHCASPIGARDNQDFSSSSIGMYDSEIACDEHDIDEELIYTTGSSTKLQPRKVKCRARWNDAIGMAEVIEQKGQMHVTMGIARGGKIYCSIEETLLQWCIPPFEIHVQEGCKRKGGMQLGNVRGL